MFGRVASFESDNRPRAPNQGQGHVESYFWRANHPHEPKAFWLKATILRPLQGETVAEVWCATFDAEGETWAARETVPLAQARFGGDPLVIRVGECRFELGRHGGSATGEIGTGDAARTWDLRWTIPDGRLFEPLCLYPTRAMVDGFFPKSKLLSPAPAMRFEGHMTWAGRRVEVDGWYGMQGHNWGKEHAYRYAWAQCLFLDGEDRPHCMAEGFSGKIKLGGVLTPWISALVVRRGRRAYRFDHVFDLWRQRVAIGDLRWSVRLRGRDGGATLSMVAKPDQVACLGYKNPDGALSYCLNSKLARTELRVDPSGEDSFECVSEHGGALEFLQREVDPRFADPV